MRWIGVSGQCGMDEPVIVGLVREIDRQGCSVYTMHKTGKNLRLWLGTSVRCTRDRYCEMSAFKLSVGSAWELPMSVFILASHAVI